jgi:hypothetical protein
VRKGKSAHAARRACLVLGALIAVFGAAQLAAMAALSSLYSAWANAVAAEGLPGALPGNEPPFELLLRLGLAWQALVITPIIVGAGGVLVYWLRRPLIGQVMVVAGTACAVAAAIPRIDFGGTNMLSLQQMADPLGGITAVPFCVALVVFAITARDDDSRSVATLTGSSASAGRHLGACGPPEEKLAVRLLVGPISASASVAGWRRPSGSDLIDLRDS